jgi:hypothetical protein
MPYNGLADGIYLVCQKAREKMGVDHYGVLDIGNRLNIAGVCDDQPRVIHQTPPQITVSSLIETGAWEVLSQALNETEASIRFWRAIKDPVYNAVTNNCEHFARFVITGNRESRQLQTVVIVSGIVTLAIWGLSRQSNNRVR